MRKRLGKLSVATKLGLSFAAIILMFVSVLVYVGFSHREVQQFHRLLMDEEANIAAGQLAEQLIYDTAASIIAVAASVSAVAIIFSVFFAIFVIKSVADAFRKEHDEALRRQTVEEESRAKTKFLARMSHEIRTPLNAMLGITEIEMLKEHAPATEEAFTRIHSSSSLLLAIINDILDLSKVEAGKLEIVSATYETAGFIVDTVQINLMHAGRTQVNFMLEVDENLPARLFGDELRCKQILNNILSNAFKYTLEGSVKLSVSRKDTDEGMMLVMRVQDTGIGMTAEQVDSLFVDFARFGDHSIQGSGLGMNIVCQMVTIMGGRIDVESEPGRGTDITVTLPQLAEDEHLLGKEAASSLESLELTRRRIRKAKQLEREPMPYGRVLVVDDMETNLYVARGLLLPYQLNIDMADSGRAAIGKIESGEVYDIIFMDHMMPEMDGMEAVKIIRSMGYTRPIVALSANALIGQSEMFLHNGFDGFVSKPININLLDHYLQQFVRNGNTKPAEEPRTEQVSIAPGQPAELSEQSIAAFIRDANKVLEFLMPFVQRKPANTEANLFRKFVISVHGLKSVFRNVGDTELAQTSSELERAGKIILEELPAYLERTEAMVARFSEQSSSGGKPQGTEPHLLERLEQVKETCEDFEPQETEEILNALQKQSWPAATNEALADISYDLLMGDYDKVIRKTEELISAHRTVPEPQ